MDVFFIAVAVILGFLLLIYVMVQNVSIGVFKGLSCPKSTEEAYKEASEDSDWHHYIEIMNEEMKWLNEANPSDVYVNSADGFKLHGFYLNNNSKKTMIYFHGINSNGYKEGAVFAHIYSELGYNVLIVRHRAHDDSQGDFMTYGVKETEDVKAWVNYINEQIIDGEIVLHGLDMGASAIAAANNYSLPNVKLMVLDSAYCSPYDIIADGFKSKSIYKKLFMHFIYKYYKKRANTDLLTNTAIDGIKKAKTPVLFVVGSLDDNCPVALSQRLSDSCPTEHELLIVDGALHAASIYKDKEAYVDKIKKYIG